MRIISDLKLFVSSINNRELATYIWLFIFIIFIFSVQSIRKGLVDLLKIISSSNILFPIVIMATYIVLVIYLMYLVNFWNKTLAKDSIIWFIGVGVVMFFNANKATKDEYHFKEIVKENIKLTIIVEFIINLYVFSLPVELFILPFISLLVLMQVVSQHNEKYKVVEKFIINFLSIIGLIIIAHAIYKLCTDFYTFTTLENLRGFLFPIILTLAYIPFIYLLALYIIYEEFFIRIDNAYRHNTLMAKYAKWKVFRVGLLNLSKLRLITKELKIYILPTRRKFNTRISEISRL